MERQEYFIIAKIMEISIIFLFSIAKLKVLMYNELDVLQKIYIFIQLDVLHILNMWFFALY